MIQFNSITLFYFQTQLCRIIFQRNRSYKHYKKNEKSRGASTKKSDSRKPRVEMENIDVTKKGLPCEEDFKSMMIQLRAEYAKAVPDKQFITEILEKTRNNKVLWNEEKLERVLYNMGTMPGFRQICQLSFIIYENLYLTNKMYFWIMTD